MVQKNGDIARHCEESRSIAQTIHYIRALCALAMTISTIVFLVSPAFAEASINIPLHHWAYDALEDLNRAGLADGSGLATKPIARMDAARLIQKAIYKIEDEGTEFSIFDEAKINRAEGSLNRLVEEFRPELIALGVTVVAKDDSMVNNIRFKLADPIHTQTIYADLKDTKRLLFENQHGLHLNKGFNHRLNILSWVEVKDFLAIEIEPSLRYSEDVEDFELETGYAKLSFWNIEIEMGRDTMWWGPGYHGSMLLSDNAYPFNLFKIGNAHPFTLPWEYEDLGKWNVDFFVGRLDGKRDWPHAKLAGLRIENSPCDYFTFGLSRTAIFGGNGRPHLGMGDYWDIMTGYGKRELSQDIDKNISDQKASIDFKLNIPWGERPFKLCSNLQVYGEWAGEDKFAPWENESPGYLAGLFICDIFNAEGLDLRAEYARDGAAWYTHGIYTSGYEYKGDIIGHHMGKDADDLFIRLSKELTRPQEYFERIIIGGQFDYETHDRSVADPERKYEAALDGTFYLSQTKFVKLLFEHEEYSDFSNISGKKSRNNLYEVEAGVKF